MSAHWRLAFRGAAWMSLLAIVIAVALFFGLGAAHAGGFVYGSGMGILSFVSMAITVSLLASRSGGAVAMIGAGSFFARLGLVAVALGIPAYLGAWPILPMLGGFAGVYVAENLLLLRMVPKTASEFGAKRGDDTRRTGAERKAET